MVNKEISLLYGILLGDGCLSRINNSYFISIVGDLKSDERSIIKIASLIEKIRNKPVKYYKREKYGKFEICISDKKLFSYIQGLGFPVGKKGTQLVVPSIFNAQIGFVIKGYFATDGCLVITNNNGIQYPRIEFSSISQILLKQLKVELNKIDINGNVYLSKKYENHWNNLYRLQINGKENLIKFKKAVGFFNPKHKEKYNAYIKNK